MMHFIVTSSITLTALLFFYYLFLEREKMHEFNRAYLLLSIVISFAIPFISIENIPELQTIYTSVNYVALIPAPKTIPTTSSVNYFDIIVGFLYATVTLILLLKFLKSIIHFKNTINNNEKIVYKKAILVLVEEKIAPHTFLHFIFINKASYFNNTIENELYEHELTHVNQKHTLDILGIELLKTIFWFNPLFHLYKKAIQLNHEFIADENVVQKHTNIPFYQYLLLNINENKNYYLASNLNYLITKKRLIMMTKLKNKTRILLKKCVLVPFGLAVFFLSCKQNTTENKSLENKTTASKNTEALEVLIDKSERIEPRFTAENDSFSAYILSHYIPSNFDLQQKNLEVRFVVKKDGSLMNIAVLNAENKTKEEELIKIIKQGPNWIPGTSDGEVVQFQQNIILL